MLRELIDTHDYAVIDKARFSYIPDKLELLPLIPHALAGQQSQLPVLMPLTGVDPIYLLEAFEDAFQHYHIGFPFMFETLLKSQLSTSEMWRHLTGQLLLRSLDGDNYLLRYYDPRVFSQLLWILSTPRLRLLMGGIINPAITGWTIFLDDHWHTVSPPSEMNNGAQLSSARLERIGYINALLNLQGAYENIEKRIEDGCLADALMEKALKYGLKLKKDVIEFAKWGFNCHRHFYKHHIFDALWQAIKSERIFFSDLIMDYYPSCAQIKADLNARRSYNGLSEL